MYEIEITLAEAISDYQQLINNYSAFYMIALAVIAFGMLLLLNMNTPVAYSMSSIAVLGIIAATFYFRGTEMINHIDSIFTRNFCLNIYFFYWNTIIATSIIHFVLNAKKQDKYTKIIAVLFFMILVINVIFSFYITGSLRNMYLMVLGNITPMIFIGNLVAILMYIYLIVIGVISCLRKE